MPITVEQALKNLTTKPAPTEVVILEPTLKGAQVLQFWFAIAIIFQIRTAIVWAAIALLAPQLGITWFMVMIALFAIKHVRPTNFRELRKLIASK